MKHSKEKLYAKFDIEPENQLIYTEEKEPKMVQTKLIKNYFKNGESAFVGCNNPAIVLK